MFFEKADEFVGGTIVGQFIWVFSFFSKELLEYFLSDKTGTFPMPVL